MQVHLDLPGGIAGDMFIAALLDAFPEHEAGVLESVGAAAMGTPVRCRLARHNDGVLAGRRFLVALDEASDDAAPSRSHGLDEEHDPHAHVHSGRERHAHRSWSDIRAALSAAPLDGVVRDHALAIFGHLAQAEAAVHGIDVERVAFHEVGAWDSIADIVAAAHLIAVLGATRWSVGAVPLGSGRVRTAHGPLPVPAPATARLLEGFATIDDGIDGERVTPTGAAILRHLCADARPSSPKARVLGRSGTGFGARVLPGLSNVVRVLIFDEAPVSPAAPHRELGVVEFEVDDQSPEDLAMGLDRLREHRDIFDVVQMPVFGKKGRIATSVRALVRAEAIDGAIAACFRETTTIGLRHHVVSGAALERQMVTVEVEGRPVRVKTVERPGGRTAKAEADDASAHEGQATRAGVRRRAERMALEGEGA